MMYVGVALVWVVVVTKLPAAVSGWRDPGRRTYWLAMFFLAVCLTADRDPIYRAVTEVTGVPNLAHGVSYGAAVLGGYFGQATLLHAYDRARQAREGRWRRWILAAGLTLYAVLFGLGPAQLPGDPAVPHVAVTTPADAMFRVVLAVLVCWFMAEVCYLAWRLAALAVQPPLRWGMRLVSLGCALIVVRLGIEYGMFPLWSASSGWTESWSYSGALYALNLVAMGGAALVALGTAVPSLVRARGALRATVRNRGARRALLPLWEAMRAITPALSNVRRGGGVTHAVLRRASSLDSLYRMVAETRDGYVTLGPYRSAATERALRARGGLRGLRGIQLDAYVDAGSLQQAAQAHTLGMEFRPPPAAPATHSAGTSFDGEVDYLVEVARWWSRLDGVAADQSSRAAVSTSSVIVRG